MARISPNLSLGLCFKKFRAVIPLHALQHAHRFELPALLHADAESPAQLLDSNALASREVGDADVALHLADVLQHARGFQDGLARPNARCVVRHLGFDLELASAVGAVDLEGDASYCLQLFRDGIRCLLGCELHSSPCHVRCTPKQLIVGLTEGRVFAQPALRAAWVDASGLRRLLRVWVLGEGG